MVILFHMRKSFLKFLSLPLMFLLMPAGPASAGRPRDPWVFRGSLPDKTGLIFLALHKEMTVAYDEEGCSLFLAWNGPAERPSGPAATGPQPSDGSAPEYRAAGAVYHRRRNGSPWSARGPQGNIPVTPEFLAARIEGGRVVFAYALTLRGGSVVSINETPEFDDHYGDKALFRNFEVTGIPAGVSIRLEIGGVPGKGMAETWGGGAAGRIVEEEGRRFLIQDVDGATPIKATWSKAGF
jgi:hypothetical protein